MTGLKKAALRDAIWGGLCKLKMSEHEASDKAKMLAALDMTA